ncbi:hypothetical protein Tco_1285970 [Tanacetum coccineum]
MLVLMVMVAMMYGGDVGSGGSDWRLEWPLWCVAARGSEEMEWRRRRWEAGDGWPKVWPDSGDGAGIIKRGRRSV